MVGAENKNVAAMRMNKVVAKLIDENLVARVDCAPRNHLSRMINVAGKDLEVIPQNLGRRVDGERFVVTNDPRKSKKEEKLLRSNLDNRVLRPRNKDDVVAARGGG